MTAINPANFNCSPEGQRLVAATEALRTGLFQPIENLDPDIAPRILITPQAPSIWTKLFGR